MVVELDFEDELKPPLLRNEDDPPVIPVKTDDSSWTNFFSSLRPLLLEFLTFLLSVVSFFLVFLAGGVDSMDLSGVL
jgi:hypothetical protein